jgi:hypothetical protein
VSRVNSSVRLPAYPEGPAGNRRLTVERLLLSGTAWFSSRPGLVVALVATLVGLLVTMPLALHLTDDIYGYPGDATGTVTDFWWWGYALTHGKPILDNVLEGVPLGSEWSQIGFSPLPVFVFTPMSALLGPILSYNILVISGFPLTAWTTFLLAKRLSMTTVPAAFSGLTFAFTPYHLEKAMGHATQTHLELLVGCLLLLAIWRAWGGFRYVIGAGALFGLQTWLEPSVAYVMVFAVAVFLLVSATVALITEGGRGVAVGRHLAAGLAMAGVSALFLPVAAFFIHRPGTTGAAAGPLALTERTLGDLATYSARFREYFQPYYNNPIVPGFIKRWELANLHDSNWTESSILLGFTVIGLAVVGIVTTRRLFPLALAALLIVSGALLSHAPNGAILGFIIHYPSYYLWHLVGSFRVYARFAWMVLLGGSLLAGMGLSALQSRIRPGKAQLLLLIPFLVAAIEFNNIPPTHVTAILPAPAEYVWLRSQPQGVLLEYPASGSNPQLQEIQLRQYLLYQMVHLHAVFLNGILNGAVAHAAKQLEPYYGPGVVDRLRSYGIRYLFVHRSDYQADGFGLPRYVDGLTYVMTINGVDIFTVD